MEYLNLEPAFYAQTDKNHLNQTYYDLKVNQETIVDITTGTLFGIVRKTIDNI